MYSYIIVFYNVSIIIFLCKSDLFLFKNIFCGVINVVSVGRIILYFVLLLM